MWPAVQEQGMRKFSFHQLELFYNVARQGGMTRAAETLHISQPAVSTQLAELERALGVPLLERLAGGRGLRLTEAGLLVYEHAARIFALAEELERGIADLKGLRSGQLIVGASTTLGEYLLPSALGRFKARYPDIMVDLKISNTSRITDLVRRGELDLGFVGEVAAVPELAVEPFTEDTLVVIAAPHHPLLNQPRGAVPVTVEDLQQHGFIAREAGSATRNVAERYLRRHAVEPRVLMELGSNEAVKHAVTAGLGIAVLSRFAVQVELRAGTLCEVPVRGWDCRRPLSIIYRRDRKLTPCELAFLEIARAL
jgi:DNA-binding transcriptional LysR family regulator